MMICGIALGFVLSSVLFINKVWRLQDRLSEEKHKARFYKRECEKMCRQVAEWETVSKCDSYDLFGKF